MSENAQQPFYEDNESRIRFVPNSKDGPSAYDVFVGGRHFYIPDRIIPSLTSPRSNLRHAQSGLEALNNIIPNILQAEGMPMEEFYAHLLKVRILELERERDSALDEVVASKDVVDVNLVEANPATPEYHYLPGKPISS